MRMAAPEEGGKTRGPKQKSNLIKRHKRVKRKCALVMRGFLEMRILLRVPKFGRRAAKKSNGN
jgi:hypothetical protein